MNNVEIKPDRILVEITGDTKKIICNNCKKEISNGKNFYFKNNNNSHQIIKNYEPKELYYECSCGSRYTLLEYTAIPDAFKFKQSFIVEKD